MLRIVQGDVVLAWGPLRLSLRSTPTHSRPEFLKYYSCRCVVLGEATIGNNPTRAEMANAVRVGDLGEGVLILCDRVEHAGARPYVDFFVIRGLAEQDFRRGILSGAEHLLGRFLWHP